MKYDFQCEDCGKVETFEMGVDQFDTSKEEGTKCPSCEGTARFKFDVAGVSICFKGDAWADKNYKEKNYRKKRSSYMASRQAKNHKTPTLQPNYKGEEASSWKEAQDAAKADGKVHETYTPLIRKEQEEAR